jgi:nickel/cobalt transporter (NicO) family protein
VDLVFRGYDLVLEEHPRYVFHLEAPIPRDGRLAVRDTNYATSEGTSRLAIRGRDGATVEGDDLPADVDQVPIRPVWQLSDAEERRTRQVDLRYHTEKPGPVLQSVAPPFPSKSSGANDRWTRLSPLLDERTSASWLLLLLIALGLGAVHAIQPGHGKTLVTAVALSPDSRIYQAVLLGMATTLAHLGTVLLLAVGLWYTRATQVAGLHAGLSQIAGFVIAAAGFWRIGRHLGGFGEHSSDEFHPIKLSDSGVVGLGLANGLVPCWDAVGLLVLAAALGRLATGVALVVAFSAGMAAVLVAVAWLAGTMKSAADRFKLSATRERCLGVACGALLAAIGLYLFFG